MSAQTRDVFTSALDRYQQALGGLSTAVAHFRRTQAQYEAGTSEWSTADAVAKDAGSVEFWRTIVAARAHALKKATQKHATSERAAARRLLLTADRRNEAAAMAAAERVAYGRAESHL